MRRGERLEASELGLPALRDRAARMIGAMPPALRALAKPAEAYPVMVSDRLRAETLALRARLSADRR
jgi:hypothetical protein